MGDRRAEVPKGLGTRSQLTVHETPLVDSLATGAAI